MPSFLRHASWREVVALFPSEADAVRNANGWSGRYGLPQTDWPSRLVTLESWSDRDLRDLMRELFHVEPRMTVDMVGVINNAILPPRLDGLPAVLVKFGDRYGMIDGKHRVNRWKHVEGNYAVLVVNA
jgi:hypothetical protein